MLTPAYDPLFGRHRAIRKIDAIGGNGYGSHACSRASNGDVSAANSSTTISNCDAPI